MTAQGMLQAIIQAMDEKLTPVVERLDNLEERIQFSGALSAEYEQKLDASIDAKLVPVLERLDRVEEQLREFTGETREAAVPAAGETVPVSSGVTTAESEEEVSTAALLEDEDWDPEEYLSYVRDLAELAERIKRLETGVDARLNVCQRAVGLSDIAENTEEE